MPYRFLHHEPIAEAVARIVRDQVTKGLAELQEEDVHEGVHQSRKRLKKIRGLVRLIRKSSPKVYAVMNTSARDLAHRMGGAREATARIECFDELCAHHGDELGDSLVADIREVLVAERDGILVTLDPTALRATVSAEFNALPQLLELEKLAQGHGWKHLEGGLKQTYTRGREAFEKVAGADEPSAELVHEWRKRCKYLRYQLQLLRDAWRPVLDAEVDELDDLGDLLGLHHDLADLDRRIDHPDAAPLADQAGRELLRECIQRRTAATLEEALTYGRRAWTETPKRFVKRIGGYWAAWQDG